MQRPSFATSLFFVFSTGCASTSYAATPSAPRDVAPAAAPSPPPAATQGAPTGASAPQNTAPNATATTKAKTLPTDDSKAPVVIYAGDLAMSADEEKIPQTLDQIIDVAESLGGFLGARSDRGVTVRVPSAQFRPAMTRIEGLGTVTHRSVSAEDVSEEFHDAQVRIQNLRSTQKRLQELIAKAGSMADTLSVERELERVTQEIDRLEGRLEFLKSRAAYSQIVVAVSAAPRVVAETKVGKDPPPSAARLAHIPVGWIAHIGIDGLLPTK